jgi:hypothetical protein
MGFQDEDDAFPEPPGLRRLRWLVTGLMVALIVGVLSIAATIVIRLGFLGGRDVVPVTAPAFRLPEAQEVLAVGRGQGTVLFLLRAPDGTESLHAFDERTGAPASVSAVTREPEG